MKTSFEYDIFIGYSQNDRAAAERLQAALEARKLKVWRDKRPCAPAAPRWRTCPDGEAADLTFETKRFIVKLKEHRFVRVEEAAPLPPAKKRGWWPFARE